MNDRKILSTGTLLRILCFAFPFLTVISAFSILHVYPVGDRTILTVDLYHQYAPFLCEFREKVMEGRSLFYSWYSGLGNEFYAAYANYGASPLNFFVIFFPYKAIPVFIALITAVRAGLASLFMGKFLSAGDNKRYDMLTVIFSSSYALCGWFVTDFWNIMWCDAMVLLPLICLGLRKLLLERKYLLYILSLGIAIISNYYAGYFICLFLVIFAPVYYVMLFTPGLPKGDPGRLCFKTLAGSAGRFALASGIAGMLSAYMVIPTYLILRHSSATGDSFPKEFKLTGDLFDFLGRFMVSANPNIRDGMANVCCGAVVVLLVPLFFTAKKETGITIRHKIGYGLLIFIMYLSFTNRALNFIWHGFHFPNQIPYRQSFIMCFLLVSMAFMTVRVLRSLSKRAVTASFAGALVFLVLFEKFGEGNEGYIQIGLTLIFLIVQGTVLVCIRNPKIHGRYFYEYLISVTVLLELFLSSCISIALVAKNEGFMGYEFYGKNREEIRSHAQEVEGTPGHDTFERTEIYPNNICDIQSLYGVKGMSIFSSTARESFVKYMRNFGFHNNGINGLRNAGLTRVTATLLGIRNLATIEQTSSVPMIFNEEYRGENTVFYSNPDAFSVGFMVSPDVLSYEPLWDNTDIFSKTNTWISYMGVPGDIYFPAGTTDVETSNAEFLGTVGNALRYNLTAGDGADITVEVNDALIGSEVYIYTNCSKGGRVTITRPDSENDISFEIRSYQTICLGTFTGDPITVKLHYNKPNAGVINLYTYSLDMEVYERMLEILGDEQLHVTFYDDTTIEGQITADNNGLLLLTVPYSEGFTVYVDGEETPVDPVGDALMAVHMQRGTHEVILKYRPAGFKEGVLISVAGAAVTILLVGYGLFRDQKKDKVSVTLAKAEGEEVSGLFSDPSGLTDEEITDGGPSEETEPDLIEDLNEDTEDTDETDD
ncbi:MAG: YfhO family protein [Clostridiales bacterium]|nr:YfhO family protein [Clostridiales bacterium]